MPRRNALHILRAGTFTATSGEQVTLTEADLQGLAESYDESAFCAPIVVGHPRLNAPAYGWVSGLEFSAAGVHAAPRDVEPRFAEMVRTQRFSKISASLYMPGTESHPVDGATAPYLRHVGFLGAAAPAIQGLDRASLSDGAGAVTIEINLAEPQRIATRLADPENDDVKTAEQQAADLAERERKIEKREKSHKAAEQKAQLKGFEEFAKGLEKDGRILPRHTPAVVALLAALPAAAEVEFAESAGADPEDMPASQALQKFLQELPKQVDYAERSGAERRGPEGKVVSFSVPAGTPVGEANADLHRRVTEFAAKHNVDYAEALTKVAAAG